jgi:thiol-disulfide isomerase/thioredoxin
MKPLNRTPLLRRRPARRGPARGLAAVFAVCACFAFFSFFSLWPSARAEVVAEVREALSSGQLDSAKKLVESARAQGGATPEVAEAMSWLARAQLSRREFDAALLTSEKTYELATKAAQQHPLDSERHLPIALGAAIEVHAQALAARGERAKAVTLLRGELARYAKTSIATRLQKNLNLLTLEGKPAPALALDKYLGPKPETLAALKGRPVLLFFWAHWCGDCKATAPIIARLRSELSAQGLQVLAPTQPYGFTAEAQDVSPEAELPYIEAVRHKSYPSLLDVPAPVSTANFLTYGASSVPTIVLLSRAGNVVLYHPGRMTYDELLPKVEAALR